MNSSNNINPIWNAATSYAVQTAAALFAGFELTDFHYSDNSSLTKSNKVYKKLIIIMWKTIKKRSWCKRLIPF